MLFRLLSAAIATRLKSGPDQDQVDVMRVSASQHRVATIACEQEPIPAADGGFRTHVMLASITPGLKAGQTESQQQDSHPASVAMGGDAIPSGALR
jgi:hypothetical protein